jgi:hypothetical protein
LTIPHNIYTFIMVANITTLPWGDQPLLQRSKVVVIDLVFTWKELQN